MPLPMPEMLPDVLDAWRLRGMAAGHSLRTIDARQATIKRLAASGLRPVAASHDELLRWLAELTDRQGVAIKRSTRATYRAHLRSFYGWLVESGRRDDDPAADLPRLKTPRAIPHPLSPVQVESVIAACADPRAWQTRAYIILAAFAGLRAHEIAKVRGEDFRGPSLFVTGKGDVTSTVTVTPVLQRLADEMPARGYWFPSETTSGHVNRSSVSTAVQRAFRRAGINAVPHSLRHHYVTQVYVASGGDLPAAQRAARHAQPSTTAIYTQVEDERVSRAAHAIPGAA